MPEPILKIQKKKYSGDTTVVSVRMPKDLLKDIDNIADLSGRTRNEIVTMSLEFSLNHTEILTQEEAEV